MVRQQQRAAIGEGVEAVKEPATRPYSGEAGQRAADKEENLSTQIDSALNLFKPSNTPLVPPVTAVTPQSNDFRNNIA